MKYRTLIERKDTPNGRVYRWTIFTVQPVAIGGRWAGTTDTLQDAHKALEYWRQERYATTEWHTEWDREIEA
jgi:hypothetical protein